MIIPVFPLTLQYMSEEVTFTTGELSGGERIYEEVSLEDVTREKRCTHIGVSTVLHILSIEPCTPQLGAAKGGRQKGGED
jgi:hypothetical protein